MSLLFGVITWVIPVTLCIIVVRALLRMTDAITRMSHAIEEIALSTRKNSSPPG